MKHHARIVVAVAVLVLGVSALALHANVLLRFSPDLGGGQPFYARLEVLENGTYLVHHTDQWAAITLYRDPACVPVDMNLMDFFDAPRAFGCRLTVEGFEIWRNGPWTGEQAPIETQSFGLGAVPIWFVDWSELQEAMSDGVVTIGELAALPSLRVGSASFFKETLHPSQAAQQTKTQIVARGTWEGGAFFFQVEETHDRLKHVSITFR